MKTKLPFSIIVARLENNRADAPYSRSRIPRPGLRPGWNMEDSPAALRAECVTPDLSARAETALARKIALAQGRGAGTAQALPPCPPAVTSEDEKRVPMPFSPPRFKTQKNGKTVEVKWMLRLLTRTVTAGHKVWQVTTSAKGDGVKPPVSASGTSFIKVHADLKSRYGSAAEADRLTAFLRFAD